MQTPDSRVLIVDPDDDAHRGRLSAALERFGYKTAGAADTEHAMHLLERSGELFDVLLLDAGPSPPSELLMRLKNSGHLQDLAVVVLAGDGEPEEAERCFDLGADDYVIRPVTPPC